MGDEHVKRVGDRAPKGLPTFPSQRNFRRNLRRNFFLSEASDVLITITACKPLHSPALISHGSPTSPGNGNGASLPLLEVCERGFPVLLSLGGYPG